MNWVDTFGKRLKQYRIEHDFTLDVLEGIIHVPAQTINRYELEQRVPKINTAIQIALALNINPLWLQGFDVPITPMYSEAHQQEASFEARKIAKAFDRAKPREQEMVRLTLSEYLDETAAAAPSQTPLPPEAEAELANYRRELEAEQKGKTSYPTAGENGA